MPTPSNSNRDSKTYHLLTAAKDEEKATSRDWVENYHGHEGILTMTDIERCIANGYVTIGEDQIVRQSEAGKEWLSKHNG